MNVFCDICWKQWPETDPDVRFHHDTRTWTCADEDACLLRRATGIGVVPPELAPERRNTDA